MVGCFSAQTVAEADLYPFAVQTTLTVCCVPGNEIMRLHCELKS